MTTNYHTAISVGAAANAATFNTPLAALDEAISNAQAGVYNVLEYGADRTGVEDSTTEIQAAINAADANYGGTVFLPSGYYTISSALSLASIEKVNVIGDGESTFIWVNSATANAFDMTGAGYCTVGGFEIRPALGVNRTAGTFFKLWGVARVRLRDMVIRTPWNGIDIRDSAGDLTGTDSTQVIIDRVRLDYSAETGWNTPINMTGASSITLKDVTVSSGTNTISGSAYIVIDSDIDTVQMESCAAGNGNSIGVGLRIQNTMANGTFAPRWILSTNCTFESGYDTATPNPCVLIAAGTSLYFANLYTASGSFGVEIDGGTHISFVGGVCTRHKQHGFAIVGGDDITIADQDIFDVALSGTSTYNGIHADGTINGLSITGNKIAKSGAVASAINLLASSITNYVISGNLCHGEPIVDSVHASTGRIFGNVSDIAIPLITSDADTTPSVGGGQRLLIFEQPGSSGEVEVTKLDDGYAGQVVTLIFNNDKTTIKNGVAADNFTLAGAADFTPNLYDTLTVIYSGALWYEVSRSVN